MTLQASHKRTEVSAQPAHGVAAGAGGRCPLCKGRAGAAPHIAPHAPPTLAQETSHFGESHTAFV